MYKKTGFPVTTCVSATIHERGWRSRPVSYDDNICAVSIKYATHNGHIVDADVQPGTHVCQAGSLSCTVIDASSHSSVRRLRIASDFLFRRWCVWPRTCGFTCSRPPSTFSSVAASHASICAPAQVTNNIEPVPRRRAERGRSGALHPARSAFFAESAL